MNIYLLKEIWYKYSSNGANYIRIEKRNRLSNDIREKKESVNIKELRS